MTAPFLPGWLTAMGEAWAGYLYGSYPIGACIVDAEGNVVGRGRNRLSEPRRAHAGVIGGHDLAHAESIRSQQTAHFTSCSESSSGERMTLCYPETTKQFYTRWDRL